MKKIVYRVYYPVCEGGGDTYVDFEGTNGTEVMADVEEFCANFRKDDVMVCCLSDGKDIPPIKRAAFSPAVTQLKSMTVSYELYDYGLHTIRIAFPFYETKRGDGGLAPFVDVHQKNEHLFGAFVTIRPDVANNAETFAFEFIKSFIVDERDAMTPDDIKNIEYEFK